MAQQRVILGPLVGDLLGPRVDDEVGSLEGDLLGPRVGDEVGSRVLGDWLGLSVGQLLTEGFAEGVPCGMLDIEGPSDGTLVGR